MPSISRELVILAWALPLLVTGAAQGADRKVLGEIDFFGYKGIDVAAIRSGLPFHEGDLFPPAKAKSSDQLKRQVSEGVRRITGHEATDISFVCCDAKQRWMAFVGLTGESYQALTFQPGPAGSAR